MNQLMFADGTTRVADLEEQLRRLIVEVGKMCERRKQKVKVAKSKVMRCSRDGKTDRMDVRINGEESEELSLFKYNIWGHM